MRLPFKIISRNRWDRIRMALDAWPKLVDHLNAKLEKRQLDATLGPPLPLGGFKPPPTS